MQKLIEFKLHAGQFPYFVSDVIGGVEQNGKMYGISLDTAASYLPDTVLELTVDEFIERVKASDVGKASEDEQITFMADEEKAAYAWDWLAKAGV